MEYRRLLSWAILLLLIPVGIIQVKTGNINFGIGLIAGAIGASIAKYIKTKQLQELQDSGLNPYDERAYQIAGRAAYAALSTVVIISALFVIIGVTAVPDTLVNPYNFLGSALAIAVFIYLFFYYYYNRRM